MRKVKRKKKELVSVAEDETEASKDSVWELRPAVGSLATQFTIHVPSQRAPTCWLFSFHMSTAAPTCVASIVHTLHAFWMSDPCRRSSVTASGITGSTLALDVYIIFASVVW